MTASQQETATVALFLAGVLIAAIVSLNLPACGLCLGVWVVFGLSEWRK